MKYKKVIPAIAIFMVGLIGSCKKEGISDVSPSSPDEELASQDKSLRTGLGAPQLGYSGAFEILSKSGITNVFPSAITGDVGSSPISGSAILLNCTEVTGRIFSVDAAGPLPCVITGATRLTAAIADMKTAYNNLAGRSNPGFLNLGAGNIGGKTLKFGLYKWTGNVTIPANITLSGGPNTIFIFQISGTLRVSSGVRITLIGGAQAKNIYWQTAGATTLGTNSHFEGNILSKTSINMKTGASINGRLLAQTAVTLQQNTVNKPN